MKATRLWTTDCGWTRTSIKGSGMANRWCASISSRPLFIKVALSTLILAPMRQFGWRTASAGVAWRIASSVAARKGPPEAVRISRSTSSNRAAARHWKMALCSESTGRSAVPEASTARIRRGPAQTRHSLLASATIRPFPMAAIVGARPAAPTMAAIVQSTGRAAASTSASAPPAASIPLPARRSLRSGRRPDSPMTARRARRASAASASASTRLCAVTASTR